MWQTLEYLLLTLTLEIVQKPLLMPSKVIDDEGCDHEGHAKRRDGGSGSRQQQCECMQIQSSVCSRCHYSGLDHKIRFKVWFQQLWYLFGHLRSWK